ncbi:hypothetical protein D3C87_2022640 [compost metagenome]
MPEQTFMQVLQLDEHFQRAVARRCGPHRQATQPPEILQLPAAFGEAGKVQIECTAMEFKVL